MSDDVEKPGQVTASDESVLELMEEPLVAPPEKLRRFLTRPRMFLGFALSVMVTVLIVRLFSLHLRHNLGVVEHQTHEPEFLAYAILCVLGYLAADAATLIMLARVLKPTARVNPSFCSRCAPTSWAAPPRSGASRSPIRRSRFAARGSRCPRRPRSFS